MNVYVESNFVLELALIQEQSASCEEILAASTEHQRAHGLSAQDALVYSSVLSHLKRVPARESCFLNRNSTDFDDQNIVDELADYNCKLLFQFYTGYSFISAALG